MSTKLFGFSFDFSRCSGVRTRPTKAPEFGPIEKLTEQTAKTDASKIIASYNPQLVMTYSLQAK